MREQEHRVPSFMTMGYFKALKYVRFYKYMPFVLASVVWGLFLIWSIIDPCVFQYAGINGHTTYYGVMQLENAFVCWLIWFAMGSALAVITYFASRVRAARLLLEVNYLQVIAEDDEVVLDDYYVDEDEEDEDEEYEDDEDDESEYDDEDDDDDDDEPTSKPVDDDDDEDDERYIAPQPSLLAKIKALFGKGKKQAPVAEEPAEDDEEEPDEEPIPEPAEEPEEEPMEEAAEEPVEEAKEVADTEESVESIKAELYPEDDEKKSEDAE